ncbi:MAG: hypothetical protein AAGJ51_02585 [Pseudomonadota bacterium]
MKLAQTCASLALVCTTLTPSAFAACDISQTKCWINGGKCNIQFKNKTAESGGSSGGTSLEQASLAQTIQVKARKANGNTAGNKLTINSGASSTMNIENKVKKDFDNIRISSKTSSETVADTNMTCAQIKAVLNGNGTCKVFNGFEKSGFVAYRLGFQCDGGNVAGPPKNN